MKTFYWHDYETWGANPSIDRPSQFAGVRTDENLNIISDPLVMYCKPPEDIWPQPQACLVTGITPQKAREHGLSESEFIAKIHREFIQPNTCVVGYNSLRFDDEVTRYTLYRNFYDPYEREWKNGNSRWDIIDMLRLCYALRPEGIEWPVIDERPSFKLENLTKANGISHMSAHDAFSDVEATIALARLVRSVQPQLYNYVLANKTKQKVASLVNVKDRKPLLHISSRFSAVNGCAALVVPLAWHPVNKNALIVYDLSVDPRALIDLEPQAIRERIYTAAKDLAEGEQRIPLKLVHLNRCPVLLTPKMLDDKVAARLHIDKALCEKHWHQLLKVDLSSKLSEVYRSDNFEPRVDPEQKLYEGFLSNEDKQVCLSLRGANSVQLAESTFVFSDERLNAMVLRYKARNYREALSAEENDEWQEFKDKRLMDGGEGCLSRDEFLAEVSALTKEHKDDSHKLEILKDLSAYAAEPAF
ncbi:Exodeoxyribonuclease I subunit C [Alteromonadaceae bacterium Bs31]|nr:Exodeoxyribonuclease I subunit C [Alteromonadaceae bacterium Bs31]